MGWDSPDQAMLVLGVVQDNPRKPGEGVFTYIERTAVEAALMKSGDGPLGIRRQMPSVTAEEVKA